MLANLITTILLALGVATGNISSNVYKGGNAFYDVEKTSKPKQKAIEQTTLIETNTINQVQWIQLAQNNYSQKYYINNNTPMVNNQYVSIYNTIYFSNHKDTNTNWAQGYYVMIMNLTNYTRNTINNITLNQSIRIDNSTTRTIYLTKYTKLWNENNITNSYIDMTLTQNNTAQLIYNELANYTENEIDTYSTDEQGTPTATTEYYYWDTEFNYTIDYLEAMSTTTIAFMFYARSQLDSSTTSQIKLGRDNETNYTNFRITAYLVNQVEVTQEVIDLPNVMYTVLTMPFSFISTAFNLTVFPGTPYALNFGNLFLTVLAIFILLWLLQKVFK